MDPGLRPVPGAALPPRVGGSVGPLCLSQPRCRGTGQHVPLVLPLPQVVVLSPAGALANYGFFFIFLGSFFCFFWQQTYPSRCPGESKTAHRELPPCQPCRTAGRAEVLLWGRNRGQEPDLCLLPQPNPLTGAGNLGYQTLCCTPEPSHGASVQGPGWSSRERTQLNAFVNA